MKARLEFLFVCDSQQGGTAITQACCNHWTELLGRSCVMSPIMWSHSTVKQPDVFLGSSVLSRSPQVSSSRYLRCLSDTEIRTEQPLIFCSISILFYNWLLLGVEVSPDVCSHTGCCTVARVTPLELRQCWWKMSLFFPALTLWWLTWVKQSCVRFRGNSSGQ